MALKVKLVKSFSGSSEDMVDDHPGLGLKKFGDERLLKDTPSIRGMVFKVKHLVVQRDGEPGGSGPQASQAPEDRRA